MAAGDAVAALEVGQGPGHAEVAKTIKVGQGREFEVAGSVFNLLNEGNFTQFNYSGAAEKFNVNFLQPRNQQPARAFQLTGVVGF